MNPILLTAKVAALFAFSMLLLVTPQISVAAPITYSIESLGIEGSAEILGGTITTDGTVGALLPSNILEMSVDTVSGFAIFNPGGEAEVIDYGGNYNLGNSTLSMQGAILATPTSIVVQEATTEGEVNSLSLVRGAGGSVAWSSGYIDFSESQFASIGFQISNSAFVGNVLMQLPETSVIATVVIPEPTTAALVVLAALNIASLRRR